MLSSHLFLCYSFNPDAWHQRLASLHHSHCSWCGFRTMAGHFVLLNEWPIPSLSYFCVAGPSIWDVCTLWARSWLKLASSIDVNRAILTYTSWGLAPQFYSNNMSLVIRHCRCFLKNSWGMNEWDTSVFLIHSNLNSAPDTFPASLQLLSIEWWECCTPVEIFF